MYHIIHVISAFIRQFYLPNPFSNLFSNQVYADLFNIIIGGFILHIMAYFMTGMVYEKNSAPGVGSFLYLFNYCLITGIVLLITWLVKTLWISIITCIFLYIVLLILLRKIGNNRYNL